MADSVETGRHIKEGSIKSFLTMTATQFLIFCLAAVYYRAIASGVFAYVFGAAVLYSMNNFFSVKRVAGKTNRWTCIGYALGSGLGSCLGVTITRLLHGGVR